MDARLIVILPKYMFRIYTRVLQETLFTFIRTYLYLMDEITQVVPTVNEIHHVNITIILHEKELIFYLILYGIHYKIITAKSHVLEIYIFTLF